MKKYLFALVTAMMLLSGCGKEYVPEEVVTETKELTRGSWGNSDGEMYTFKAGYQFEGTVLMEEEYVKVKGTYSIVTDAVSEDVTISINAGSYQESFIVEVNNKKTEMELIDPETDEVVKTLKYQG